MKLNSYALPLLASLLPFISPSAPAAELQRSDVEQIVREYLVSHPELLIEMSNALRAKQEADQEKADISLINQYRQEIYKQPNDPVGGNAKGSITIVEFFDYNCGYCKRAKPALVEVMGENKEIRYIYKEFPILSETSYLAARTALAVQRLHPEKYEAFHNALMDRQGPLKDESELAAIAKSLGLNWNAIQAKAKESEIDNQLQENHKLAQQLGLTGTPAFIIGETILRGAPRSADDIRAMLNSKS
ncbi:MAG: DsbA family protein [Aeromonadaceae bacterium]